MGRILQPKVEYIKEVTNERMNNDYNEYSKFLDSTAPIFVTYYNQSIINSTVDNGFGNTYGNVTSDLSSKKYNKINNLPLYKVPKTDLEMMFEDNRMTVEFKSDGIILPNTIMPIQEDYLVITYMEKIRIFKVIGIETDNIKSNKFFKIEFKYDISGEANVKKLDNRVINEFECIFDKIGTQENCLILSNNIEYLKNLQTIYDELTNDYFNLFFESISDSFIFKWAYKRKLYDPYLTKFISDNKLFEKEFSTNSIHITEKLKPLCDFKRKYNNSIYNLIQNKKDFKVYRNRFRALKIYDLSNYFGTSGHDYCQLELSDRDDPMQAIYYIPYINFEMFKEELPIGESIELFGKSLFIAEDRSEIDALTKFFSTDNNSTLKTKMTFLDKDFKEIDVKTSFEYRGPLMYYFREDRQIEIFKEIIRNYYKMQPKESISYIIDNLSEFNLSYRFDYFLYTPLILFIIKNFIDNNIINKEL